MARAALRACEQLVRHGLRGVWVRGEPPAGAFVWAANHHCWWDPFLAATVIGRSGRAPSLLVAQENLERFGVARLLGGFGTGQLRRGLQDLRRGRVLVVFPEAELRPPGALGELAGGAAWYARRGAVPLSAVACRVVLRGHQAAEAYLSMSTVDTGAATGEVTASMSTVDTGITTGQATVSMSTVDTGAATGEVTARLRERITTRLRERITAQLRDLDELIASCPAREPLPGFELCLRGRRSWDERIGGARPDRGRPWSRR